MDPNINARINCCFRLEPKSESKDARVHCVVLKVRAVPTPSDHHYGSAKQEKVQKVQSETLSCSVPVPQDPTACNMRTLPAQHFPSDPEGKAYSCQIDPIRINVNVPPMSASQERSSRSDLAPLLRPVNRDAGAHAP